MAVQDYAYSSIEKSVLKQSVTGRTLRTTIKSFEYVNYAK